MSEMTLNISNCINGWSVCNIQIRATILLWIQTAWRLNSKLNFNRKIAKKISGVTRIFFILRLMHG